MMARSHHPILIRIPIRPAAVRSLLPKTKLVNRIRHRQADRRHRLRRRFVLVR
jgi:hypothetical protein